jgi:hypothetical protein
LFIRSVAEGSAVPRTLPGNVNPGDPLLPHVS